MPTPFYFVFPSLGATSFEVKSSMEGILPLFAGTQGYDEFEATFAGFGTFARRGVIEQIKSNTLLVNFYHAFR